MSDEYVLSEYDKTPIWETEYWIEFKKSKDYKYMLDFDIDLLDAEEKSVREARYDEIRDDLAGKIRSTLLSCHWDSDTPMNRGNSIACFSYTVALALRTGVDISSDHLSMADNFHDSEKTCMSGKAMVQFRRALENHFDSAGTPWEFEDIEDEADYIEYAKAREIEEAERIVVDIDVEQRRFDGRRTRSESAEAHARYGLQEPSENESYGYGSGGSDDDEEEGGEESLGEDNDSIEDLNGDDDDDKNDLDYQGEDEHIEDMSEDDDEEYPADDEQEDEDEDE